MIKLLIELYADVRYALRALRKSPALTAISIVGIRMALGAQRKSVLGLVLGRGVTIVAIGVTAGVLGALALTRYLEGMLYGITALDGATYAAVAAAFAAVALFASYMPARRATRVDPLVALRHE